MLHKRPLDMVRISEVFTSIEGEGILVGTKTLFVRLAGCPLRCHWCDTTYAIPVDSGNDISIDDVKKLMEDKLQQNTYKVNFTGGEPLIQADAVVELAKFARSKGLKTYLESACYDAQKFDKILPYIDICKVEFKLKDSKAVDSDKNYQTLLKNELDCLKLAVAADKKPYIKIVVTNSSDPEELANIARRVFSSIKPKNIAGFIIQPSYGIDEPLLDRLFAFYDAVYPLYDQVRVVPQLHKLIGAR